MFANGRGSKRLAGAAPLEHRVPAAVGSFCSNRDIAQWIERQTDNLLAAGSTPAIRPLCKQHPTTSEPGWAPAVHTR